ncbi:FAD-dependent oxidoreductase [Lihuaxuella thermophila]|uniref:FAD-dependent oxidoreductase n=1 Tax=Lihuaxuella thermophila TaxID=1173111 RepID=UPI003CC7A84D
MGCIPPNLLIEIPYRMLLPKGLDGILVIGKAISATHDALPAIRMQADLENLGRGSGDRRRPVNQGRSRSPVCQHGEAAAKTGGRRAVARGSPDPPVGAGRL